MRYHYISDSHVHSDCSFDGTDPVMMICERAAASGTGFPAESRRL